MITANTQEMYRYSSVLLLVFPNKTLLTLWLSPLPLCFSLLWPRNASEEFYSKFLFSPMGIWTHLVTWLKHFNTLPLIFIYFSFFFSPFVSIYLGHVRCEYSVLLMTLPFVWFASHQTAWAKFASNSVQNMCLNPKYELKYEQLYIQNRRENNRKKAHCVQNHYCSVIQLILPPTQDYRGKTTIHLVWCSTQS